MDAIYGYQAVNVEAQARDPSSLLNWMRRMLAVRKQSRAFGRGRLAFLKPGNRKVLAYLRETDDEAILCVANMGRSAQPVELDLKRYRGRVPVEMLGRTAFPPIGDLPYLLTLPAHGFYWFRLDASAEVPNWHAEQTAPEDLPVLVLFDGWTSFFRDRVVPWRIGMAETVRTQLEGEVLPRYLESRRWYAAKGEPLRRVRLAEHVLWEAEGHVYLLAVVTVEGPAKPARYLLPLALAWEETEDARVRPLAGGTIAKARQQARIGVIADAMFDEAFAHAVVGAIADGQEVAAAPGRLRFVPTKAFETLAGPDYPTLEVSRPQFQSSNSVVALGERLFFKLYRRLRPGVNPEFEIGRFLTDVARFEHCVPVAGAVEYVDPDGAPTTLAILQAYVTNSGDGWAWAVGYLERFLETQRTRGADPAPADAHGGFLALVHTLGTRTAALHRALAMKTGNPAFDPEPFTDRDRAEWQRRVRGEATETLTLLARAIADLDEPARADAEVVLAARDRLLQRVDDLRGAAGAAVKTRCHGDYHLGQVLLASNDFVIIDFEGEPGRPLEERRSKSSPLRDVAGMLRSFDYARATALRNVGRGDGDHARLDALGAEWLAAARRAFLDAYDESMRAAGAPGLDAAGDLLVLAELEKALYELRYELANRPAWVGIPLAGVRALADLPAPG
jgi:maltose alpha-D-glucosyltransferase/alpha-amylase